jgi:hypothetical protein
MTAPSKETAVFDLAIAEAFRFIERATAARNSFTEKTISDYNGGHSLKYWEIDASKNAAAKRASLDLTKALSAFRKRRR